MNPDIEGLKAYIGGLVLDVFTTRGQVQDLARKLADLDTKSASDGVKSESKPDVPA